MKNCELLVTIKYCCYASDKLNIVNVLLIYMGIYLQGFCLCVN